MKIGVVVDETLDPKTYSAVVKFSINKKIQIPTDSTAKISSEGLIGGKYLAIVPGADDEMLANNQELKYTQSSINLETLIGKMVFSKESSAPSKPASE